MTKMIQCRSCENGEWYTACCNGSGGCSCRGEIIPMGTCNVCGGTGEHAENADPLANVATIRGYGFIGSGPAGGYFGCLAMGIDPERRS